MKETFKGYYKKTDVEIKEIWKNGIISVDTNVLLNLYRYSENTRNELLKTFKKLNDKLFLTHQSMLEFHRNRFEVILEQEDAYKTFSTSITKIEDELKSKSRHPFLDNDLQIKFIEVLNAVKADLNKSEKKYAKYQNNDEIYDELDLIFNKNIGLPYDDKELCEIYKEGQDRYVNKIPPGYEDEKDKKDNKKYGDLILWKQLIDFAKKEKKAIILISEERKSDWWWKNKNGNIIGPRFELVQEILKEAGVEFHMYSTERFLEFASEFLKEKQNQKALQEIREFKKTINRIDEKEAFTIRAENLKSGMDRYLESKDIRNDFLIEREKNERLSLSSIYRLQNRLKYLTSTQTETIDKLEYLQMQDEGINPRLLLEINHLKSEIIGMDNEIRELKNLLNKNFR